MITHSVAEQLRLIDRAVTILTRSTEALLRATSEESLLQDICHIAVDVAGYNLAWVGYPSADATRPVTPVAVAGPDSAYLDEVHINWNDDEDGGGPTGTAIRTGATQIIRDCETDPEFAPWRDVARKYRLRSTISLPLGDDKDRLGALNIYSGDVDSFDSDVIRLLEGLASNVTYGVRALRMKAEHDRAIHGLAESESRYRLLIETSPDAIIVHSHGTILFANPASATVFGAIAADEMVGHPITDLVHEDCPSAAEWRLGCPGPGQNACEFRLRHRDGTPFDAEVISTAIVFHGLSAQLVIIRDVTDRKQVQAQLIQATKLATLGEMAAGLVHELSQPLNIIRMTAEGALLFIERGKATPDWQAQQFQVIADQSQRTAEMIDDIRIFSRRDDSPEQIFDAIAAIRAAIGVFDGQLRPDDIALVADLPSAEILVKGRAIQLEQVVMNLLANAHHALKDKQERHETNGWSGIIRVATEINANRLTITVSDNGPGIPPTLRDRIFEPFFTTKDAGRGTGLGLSVSFSLIAAMGGQLEAVSQPLGACFCITLPVTGSRRTTPASPPEPPPSPADAHIMVVDDERTAGDALAHFLRELGYRVSTSNGGTQAWRLFSKDPADVVITDLRMPAGSGEQLVEQLRDYDPLLPVIIVTGHLGATERLNERLQDDRCAVLKKPVALGKLAGLVAGFLHPPI